MNTYERLVLRLLLAICEMLLSNRHWSRNGYEVALCDETREFLAKTPKM